MRWHGVLTRLAAKSAVRCRARADPHRSRRWRRGRPAWFLKHLNQVSWVTSTQFATGCSFSPARTPSHTRLCVCLPTASYSEKSRRRQRPAHSHLHLKQLLRNQWIGRWRDSLPNELQRGGLAHLGYGPECGRTAQQTSPLWGFAVPNTMDRERAREIIRRLAFTWLVLPRIAACNTRASVAGETVLCTSYPSQVRRCDHRDAGSHTIHQTQGRQSA